jgi:hypothetical protein
MGNHALGCRLAVEVAKRVGTMPNHRIVGSTADVTPLLRIAAGLPVTNDDWYECFTFTGLLECVALSHVFAEEDIVPVIVQTKNGQTVGLAG